MLSENDVRNNQGALIKWLYRNIFNWLIRKVNFAHSAVSAGDSREVVKFVGILDIFGFEILGVNSFEQLCINYTNERLQQQFNEHVFVLEQQEYAKEGLDWKSISYRDNQTVIDLISKKSSGLLLILEEHGMMNRKPDDLALVNSFNQMHDKVQPSYVKSRFGNDRFVVKHFAGDVTYTVDGFLSKNNDSLQEGLTETITTSSSIFLKNLLAGDDVSGNAVMVPGPGFIPIQQHAVAVAAAPVANDVEPIGKKLSSVGGGGGVGGGASSKRMASTITVSYQFRNQLDVLMSTLRSTQPHYVKCIKPNALKAADTFTAPLVVEQLRYSGVLEVVRIRREGFPSRITFQDFYAQYVLLAFGKNWKLPTECSLEEAREYCIVLTKELLPTNTYQIGTNFVFLGHTGPDDMLTAINNFYKTKATLIQSRFRRNQAVGRYQYNRCRVLLVSTIVRMFLARLHFRRIIRQVSGIQKCYRLLLFKRLLADSNRRRVLKRRHDSATLIQSKVRMMKAKRLAIKTRRNLTNIQVFVSKWYRMHLCRGRYKRSIVFAIRIENQIRVFLMTRQFKRSKMACITLQTKLRSSRARWYYKKCLLAIIRIQAMIRKFIRFRSFVQKKRKITLLQARIRTFLLVNHYNITRIGFIKLQARLRSFKNARVYNRIRWLMMKLQARWRSILRRRIYVLQKNAAIRLETRWRTVLAVKKYVFTKLCILRCQQMARMWKARHTYVRVLHGLKQCQKLMKLFLRKRNRQAKEGAAIFLQSRIRLLINRSKYLKQRIWIIKLQSLLRKFISRKRFQRTVSRIILLQSRIRMFLKLFKFRVLRWSVIAVQRVFRGYISKNKYQQQRTAIIRIQSLYRMLVEQALYAEAQFSILLIQSSFRMFSARAKYDNIRASVLVLQKNIRKYQAQNEYKKCIDAATKINSLCRMFNCLRQYEVMQFSVLLVQSQVRRFLAENHYFLIKFSTLVLQAKAREYIARRDYQQCRQAIIQIQSFGRKIIAQNAYDLALFSVVMLQTAVRKYLSESLYTKQRRSIVRLQSFSRMSVALSAFRLQKYSTTMVS